MESKDSANNDLVSVIIPNFNSRKYIRETLQSIYLQSYNNFEIVLVDDCSSDGSIAFIESLDFIDDRLKIHVLKENNGRPAIPRNYGISKAKGKYIAFMDSDDIWHKDKLTIQLEEMIRCNADFSCTSLVNFINSNELSSQVEGCPDGKVIRLSFKKLLYKNIIPNSSVVVRTEKLNGMEFYEDERYKAIEDYHLWLRLLQAGLSSIKLNRPLLFYRISETSISKYKFQMFKKSFMLLSEFQVNNKSLGLWTYFYMASYVYYSLVRVIRKKM